MALVISAVAPAREAFGASGCYESPNGNCVTTTAGSGEFEVGAEQPGEGASGAAGAAGSNGTTRPIDLPDEYVIYDYAPTCDNNTRENGDLLCTAAVTVCADRGPGYINYWRWEATVVRATGRIKEPPGWVQSAGTFCRGPADVGVPPIAAIGGVIAADFQDLVVLKGRAIAEPDGATLVNYDTGFYTEAAQYVLPATTVLGARVVVTAIPERYDWYFGDGSRLLDGGPGRRGTLEVAHRYTRNGSVAPYVVITWRGTFTVDGGPARNVIGTATTTGPGTPLQVKQARAERVAG